MRDAPEACPVCAAVAWVRIGGAVLCERCGHAAGVVREVAGGVQMRLGGIEDDVEDSVGISISVAEFEAGTRSLRVRRGGVRAQAGGGALLGCGFPSYAAPGLAESAAGRYDGTGEVVVHHDPPDDFDDAELLVSTIPRGEQRIQEPRLMLASMLDDDFHDDDDRSPGGALVAFAHREREAGRSAARAEPAERDFVIDGRAEPFVFLGARDAWVATREHGDVSVMVSARGVAPGDVTLEPLADLATRRPGRSATSSARRSTSAATRPVNSSAAPRSSA